MQEDDFIAENEVPSVEAQEDEVLDTVENTVDHADSEDTLSEDRPVSRAEARVQRLANEKRAAELERDNARQQQEFYRQQLEKFQSQKHVAMEEDLDPDEKWRRTANQALQQNQFETQDALDQVKFLSKLAANPALAIYQEKVEAELQKARSQGKNATREMVLKFVVGEEALAKMAKAPAAKREAAIRVKEAQGTPLGTKSNVVSSSKKAPSTAKERLKDITF